MNKELWQDLQRSFEPVAKYFKNSNAKHFTTYIKNALDCMVDGDLAGAISWNDKAYNAVIVLFTPDKIDLDTDEIREFALLLYFIEILKTADISYK